MLIYYTNINIAKNNIVSSIITIASIYLMQGFITARAQIITYICCILTVLFIDQFLETSQKRYLVGLFLVPIVLANCHAALFPIYFVIYLPYIAEYVLSYFTKEEMCSKRIYIKGKIIKRLEDKLSKVDIDAKKENLTQKLDKKTKMLKNLQDRARNDKTRRISKTKKSNN